ncbi:16S rRNA (cytidine(1402)-2'-O)-methyltransferase [Fusibacter tunisiensis]|uniref:Ribosomal RNA small subunit methyltransferase I n=1 Tax=Fusibacter tunisiensis TaxID=1008308 RepID=A0ABS2MP95_9FIRM|nr:16S rRNA (cytidine(1402)-2'-O)-methyltransferase [Fusibacter tunisiensis]MBM7561221.1 16S rRNA (cytidine1402-2'-O)-methyltransferase [Fusibacter tunisiensis]
MSGKVMLCGTPIGNLEDITLRVLNALKGCDVVYAEDTRQSLKLLNHFDIKKPIYSYHEHNKSIAGPEIIEKALSGQKIALVTDAGMPGISDPGEDLVLLCIEKNVPFEIVPGVTAFSTALVGSGFSTAQFVFEGFLSRDKRQKKKHIERLKFEQRTLIFYESPHRLKETLKLLLEGMGNRNAVVARELTKRYETFRRGLLSELIDFYEGETIKGEIVLLLEGNSENEEKTESNYTELSVQERYDMLLAEGMDRKSAMKTVAAERHLKKTEVYSILNR